MLAWEEKDRIDVDELLALLKVVLYNYSIFYNIIDVFMFCFFLFISFKAERRVIEDEN